jgi:hypothetical protein
MSAKSYDATESITLMDFSNVQKPEECASAEGVQLSLVSDSGKVKSGQFSGLLTTTNINRNDSRGAWAKAGKTYVSPINLDQKEALGVWIFGDGQGEILNFQLRSPEPITGGIGDRYIVVDFQGWRYFELVEFESERYSQYQWPYGSLYAMYRENVDFSHIETFTLWCNNIPRNQTVRCWLSPIKALPLKSIRIKNPAVTIQDRKIIFPVELESGQYLEFRSPTDCKLFGSNGELLREIKPAGEIPNFINGNNRIQFTCEGPTDINPRTRITVISQGEEQ